MIYVQQDYIFSEQILHHSRHSTPEELRCTPVASTSIVDEHPSESNRQFGDP